MNNRILKPHLWKINYKGETGDVLRQLVKERNDYKNLAEVYIEKYFNLLNKSTHLKPVN